MTEEKESAQNFVYDPQDFADLAEYLIGGEKVTKHDRVSIGRKTTPEGERVVFIKGTEVLAEVPTEVIREAAAFITKCRGDTTGASVTFSLDSTYKLHVAAWYGGQMWVTLHKMGDLCPWGVWDIIEVDPF